MPTLDPPHPWKKAFDWQVDIFQLGFAIEIIHKTLKL
jgi:hypothetical protein